MKMSKKIALGVVAGLVSLAGAASAQVVYNNPYVFGINADCSFSTTCAALAVRGDDFAAQEFTLTNSAVLTAASFTEVDFGTGPTAANWGFLVADGAGGLPGTILAAGTNNISSVSVLGSDFGGNVNQEFFNLGTVALGPGTYYFAVQAVSPVFSTYLGWGAASGGAAETMDGGVTWTSTYEGFPSVAISLSTPEPAAWVTMLIGFAGVGAALRRRAKASATVA